MSQTLIVAAIILAAAAYLAFRAWTKLSTSRRAKAGPGGCGPDCGCG